LCWRYTGVYYARCVGISIDLAVDLEVTPTQIILRIIDIDDGVDGKNKIVPNWFQDVEHDRFRLCSNGKFPIYQSLV